MKMFASLTLGLGLLATTPATHVDRIDETFSSNYLHSLVRLYVDCVVSLKLRLLTLTVGVVANLFTY